MTPRIQTVGDLRALLVNHGDDTPLIVAPNADRIGWAGWLLAVLGTAAELPGTVVLAISEDTVGSDELTLTFPQRPV